MSTTTNPAMTTNPAATTATTRPRVHGAHSLRWVVALLSCFATLGVLVPDAGASDEVWGGQTFQQRRVTPDGRVATPVVGSSAVGSPKVTTATFNTPGGAPRAVTIQSIYNSSTGRYTTRFTLYQPQGTNLFQRQLSTRTITTPHPAESARTIVQRAGQTYLASVTRDGMVHLVRLNDNGSIGSVVRSCACAPAGMAWPHMTSIRVGARSFVYVSDGYPSNKNPFAGNVRVLELVPLSLSTDQVLRVHSTQTIPHGPWTGMTTYHRGGKPFIFLMNSHTGRAEVRNVGTAGLIGARVGDHYSWTTGWRSVHAFDNPNGVVLVLNKTSGQTHIHHPVANGRVGNRVQAFNMPVPKIVTSHYGTFSGANQDVQSYRIDGWTMLVNDMAGPVFLV